MASDADNVHQLPLSDSLWQELKAKSRDGNAAEFALSVLTTACERRRTREPKFAPLQVARRSFATREDKAARLLEIHEELKSESDRGFVLVLHCHLDSELDDLIRLFALTKGAPLELADETVRHLSSFYAKTRVATAFGLLPLFLSKAIVAFNELRNRVAHGDARFALNNEAVSEVAKHLDIPEINDILSGKASMVEGPTDTPRIVLSSLVFHLAEFCHEMSDKRSGVLAILAMVDPDAYIDPLKDRR